MGNFLKAMNLKKMVGLPLLIIKTHFLVDAALKISVCFGSETSQIFADLFYLRQCAQEYS